MPRFNIFKVFSKSRNADQSKESKPSDRAGSISEPPPEGDTTNDRPTRKPRTLTKRRPSAPQPSTIQPSYSVRSEDIGYHDLGRYPTKVPEPILADSSNPPNYRDTHPRFVEDTKLEYPTTNNESFNPRSQSSKLWSPVPDVYREPATEEYEDNTNPMRESPGPHYHQPQRGLGRDTPLPTRPRHLPETRRRRHSDIAKGSQNSDDSTVGMDTRFEHTTEQGSREMSSHARLGDTQGIRYVRDHVHDQALQQGVSMRATPLNLSARRPSLSSRSRARGEAGVRDSDIIEPVVFEHQVLREDGDPHPKIWHYIVPGGLDVIFKDEDGNELTRVRNTGGRSSRRRITPMQVEDEHGNVIHRMGDFDSEADDSRTRPDTNHRQREYPYESRYQRSGSTGNADSEPIVRAPTWMKGRPGSSTGHVYTSYLSPDADKVFLIDEHGGQIPIADRKKGSSVRRKQPRGHNSR